MATYVTNTSDRSKLVALLLCCLGLIGVAGIHRFYTGKVVSGVIWLLTGGLFGIGTIIDLISIALGSFRDNVGAPLRQ